MSTSKHGREYNTVVPRGECQADDRAEAALAFEAEDAMADNGRL